MCLTCADKWCTKQPCPTKAMGLENLRAWRHFRNPVMKKPNHSSKPLHSPKPVRAIRPTSDNAGPQPASPSNISRERLMDGASATTEVLSEILQHQKQTEPMRHWGINE